jgi:hypothetical protein
MPNDIVDDAYGPPHYYGSTIWDVLRPNPGAQKETYQNIYGAGYIGKDINQVTEPRSPFGRLLQGIGIIGEPDARPLTDYEQMLYQEGKRYKSNVDTQTEHERLTGLQSKLNIAQDYIQNEGKMPPKSMLDLLPSDWQEGLKHQLYERYAAQSLKKKSAKLGLLGMHALIGQRERSGENTETTQELLRRNAVIASPPSKMLQDQWRLVMKDAMQEGDPNRKSAKLAEAEMLKMRLIQYLRSQNVNLGPDEMFGSDIMSPFKKEPNPDRVVDWGNDPSSVDRALDMYGVYGGQE